MKTALVSPPLAEPPPNDFGPPYAMAMAAACLEREGQEVVCRDFSRDPGASLTNELLALIEAEAPRCLGLFFGSAERQAVFAAADALRARFPDLFLVLDGELPHGHAELLVERTLAHAVMPKESELVWPELVTALDRGSGLEHVPGLVLRQADGIHRTSPRQAPGDLDALPDPAYHLVRPRTELATPRGADGPGRFVSSQHCSSIAKALVVYSSRGCAYRCSYCPESLAHGPIRAMSPERFVAQLAQLREACGAHHFIVADSLFTHDRERVLAISRLLCDRELGITWSVMTRPDFVDRALLEAMAAAGCAEVAYGVESGSRAVQRALRKNVQLDTVADAFRDTQAAGMAAVLLLMVGNPGESASTVRETLVAVRDLVPDRVLVNTTKLEPGTALYQQAEARGLVGASWLLGPDRHPPANTLELGAAELADLRAMIEPRCAFVDLASLGEGAEAGLWAAARRSSAVVLGAQDPLLRADFPELMRAGRDSGVPRPILYTSARALHPRRRATTILGWGAAREILVPLFSDHAEAHDAHTGIAGSFEQTRRGVAHWRAVGGSVALRIAVGDWALGSHRPMVELVRQLGADSVCFFFHESPEGWERVEVEWLPRLSEAMPTLRRAAEDLRDRGVRVALSGIPACIAGDLDGLGDAARPFDELHGGEGSRPLLLQRRARKVYAAVCEECPKADLCEGLWTAYRDRHGDAELCRGPEAPSASPPAPVPSWARTDRSGLRRALHSLAAHPPGDVLASQRVDELYIMQSFGCSLRCDYCWLWGKTGLAWDEGALASYKQQLPVETIFRLIEELLPYRVRQVNLSGGEPLSGTTWYALAEHAHRLGLPIALTTSGVKLEHHVEGVCEVFDQVNVSINGPPSIAETVRPGPPGHYDAMIRGLQLLTERKRAGARGPKLRVLSTISDTNYGHLGELLHYLRAQDIDVDQLYYQFLIYNDAETLAQQEAIHRQEFGTSLCTLKAYSYIPQGMDFDLLWSQVEEVRKTFPQAQFSAPVDRRTLERYYRGQKEGIVPQYCAVCWTELDLMPNGDLSVCPDIPLGNIREASFGEIWNGPVARKLRRRVMSELFPACRGCFHYWGDRGAREAGNNQPK